MLRIPSFATRYKTAKEATRRTAKDGVNGSYKCQTCDVSRTRGREEVTFRKGGCILFNVHRLPQQWLIMRLPQFRQIPEYLHVNLCLERYKHCSDHRQRAILPHASPDQITMCRIVIRDLLRLLTDVKPRRAMRAPQPDPSDLIGVDITQSIPVKDKFKVCSRISRVDISSSRDVAHASLVQQWEYRARGSHGEVYRPVELEEDVTGIMCAEGAEFADRALLGPQRDVSSCGR